MKRFLKIVLAIILLLIAGVVALVIFVDPNDYKAEIEQQAEKSLNRKLAINGDLGWIIFPKLAIATGQIELKNAPGFSKDNLAKIDRLSISVDVMPLLSGEIKLGQLSLDGLAFNLETNSKGVTNLEGMGGSAKSSPTSDSAPKTTETKSELPKLQLAGIDISNTLITVIDKKLGTETDLSIKLIELGAFELGKDTTLDVILSVVTNEFVGDLSLHAQMNVNADLSAIALNELTLDGSLKGDNVPAGKMDIALKSKAHIALAPVVAKIDGLAIDVNGMKIGGSASVALLAKTKVRFDLTANEWDLNPLIPAPVETKEVASTEEAAPEVEPDLSILNTLDVDGQLTVAGFKAKGINVGKTALRVIVKEGTANLAPLSVDLYEGNMTLNAKVSHDGGKNSYWLDKKLTGVQILPLLKDAADVDMLAGSTEFNLVAQGEGLTVSKIKQGLDGKGSFAIRDGALYGINLAQKLRSAKAALGSSASEEEQKTDFTALTGKFTMKQGVVDNTSLLMEAPFIRLNGQGTANILKELVDYHLKVTLVGTSKGQNGGTDLAGLAIPLKVTGSFTDPKFGLDTGGALKAKLDQEKAALNSKLNDAKAKANIELDKAKAEAKKKAKDKLKNKLKGLF